MGTKAIDASSSNAVSSSASSATSSDLSKISSVAVSNAAFSARADHDGLDEFGNEELSRRVNIYLRSRHFDSFSDLDIEVDEGAVIISGKLDTYHQKQVAINSCQRVAGVITLIDRITVQK